MPGAAASRIARRWPRAVRGNITIVGLPEEVAGKIVELHTAGIDGVQLSFFDCQPNLNFFGERVLPLLHEAGLRHQAQLQS